MLTVRFFADQFSRIFRHIISFHRSRYRRLALLTPPTPPTPRIPDPGLEDRRRRYRLRQLKHERLMKQKIEEGSSSTSSKLEKRRLKNERSAEKREKRLEEISLLRKFPYKDHERWWTSDTIAVVTGANRGIGFAIAHQLATHGVTVVLTSRKAARGEEAAKVLQERGLNVASHQLDIVDHSSIDTFAEWLRQTYGGLDILVNNAGVNFNVEFQNSVKYAEKVIESNYYGTKNMVKAMIPLMRPSPYGARIVNVSSRLGRLNGRRNRIKDRDLRNQLDDTRTLCEQTIDHAMRRFLKEVNAGTWESGGWPVVFTDYSMSKLAVNAYTKFLAKNHSNRPEGHKIYVNCYCPGWVKTAMTGWAGHSTPEQGADTGVWLALLPPDQIVSGKFFAERREIHF